MDRTNYVLAVLSASDGLPLTPVQIQKLLFLLDRKAAALIEGPRFNFEAYDYGPFDKSVYAELRELERGGGVAIDVAPNSLMRKYRPTESGLTEGHRLLEQLPNGAASYIRRLSAWVRHQSFASLVAWVYKEYPEMKANSVFKD